VGPNACKNVQGVHFPIKPPQISLGMRIFNLNMIMYNFLTMHAISAHFSSIHATRHKKCQFDPKH
jgi:hypothetical protein